MFDDPPALPLIFQSLKPVLDDEIEGTRAAPRMPLGFSTLCKVKSVLLKTGYRLLVIEGFNLGKVSCQKNLKEESHTPWKQMSHRDHDNPRLL